MNTIRIFYGFIKDYYSNIILLILQVFICSFISFSFVSNLQSLIDTQRTIEQYNVPNIYSLKIYLDDEFPINLSKNNKIEFKNEYIEKVKSSYSFIEGNFLNDSVDANSTIILIGDLHFAGDNLDGLKSKTLYRGIKSHKTVSESLVILGRPKTITDTFPQGNSIVNTNWNKVINLDTQNVYYLSYEDFFEEANDLLYIERMLFNTVMLNPSQDELVDFSDFIYKTTQTVVYPSEVINNPYVSTLITQNTFSLVIIILILTFIIFNIVFFFMSLIDDNQFVFSVYYLLGASKYQLLNAISLLTIFILIIPLSLSWMLASLNPDFGVSLPILAVGIVLLILLCILPSIIRFNRSDLSTLINRSE